MTDPIQSLDGGDRKEIMSKLYRLMIYFAHSTMVMYALEIVSHDKMTVQEFKDKNEGICKRVFDEGLSIMNYELSSEQMSKACYVYLQSKYYPQSVKNSKPYTPPFHRPSSQVR